MKNHNNNNQQYKKKPTKTFFDVSEMETPHGLFNRNYSTAKHFNKLNIPNIIPVNNDLAPKKKKLSPPPPPPPTYFTFCVNVLYTTNIHTCHLYNNKHTYIFRSPPYLCTTRAHSQEPHNQTTLCGADAPHPFTHTHDRLSSQVAQHVR